MSSYTRPISPTRFALALKDLPLSSIHAKAAELANSIAHLKLSNEQLREFAEQGDKECAEAVAENEVVMQSMEERILLCRMEVEGNRGLKWEEVAESETESGATAATVNGQREIDREGRDPEGEDERDRGDGGVYL
jgi:hypothetical protein